MRVRPLASVLAAAMVAGGSAWPVGNMRAAERTTPIEHFMVLMQENHSFDNYFGTYEGADGIPPATCMPRDPTEGEEPCVEPYPLGDRAVTDLGHNRGIYDAEFRNGAMDGFVWAHRSSSNDGALAMGYYDDSDLPYYWNVADNFVLFDRFFSSAAGGSVWNHMYWVTGTPGNPAEDSIPAAGFDIPTIFDRLEEAGVSWKFYVQNYDPTITYRSRAGQGDRGSQVVWVPLLAYDRFIDDPELFSHIVDMSEYFEDLEAGTLPEVVYMVPSGASEHPPGSIQSGQRFVRTLINAMMRSDYWESSAFMWTYDDWGGWYDHVPPPQVDAYGYGFRVPTLLVSPYARAGSVDSTVLDFTSVMKFIEENWGLEPLAERDAAAVSFMAAFDFDQPARAPVFLPAERDAALRPEPNRVVIYVAYLAAFVLAGMFGFEASFSGVSRRLRRLPALLARWPMGR